MIVNYLLPSCLSSYQAFISPMQQTLYFFIDVNLILQKYTITIYVSQNQNSSMFTSYPNFRILTACIAYLHSRIALLSIYLFRNKIIQCSIGSAVSYVAYITGIDTSEVKVTQAECEESERIYWLVLRQFLCVQIICCFWMSKSYYSLGQ